MAVRESPPHFLLLPVVEQGHLNPMLNLASQLVALGCRVTFAMVDKPTHAPASSTPAHTPTSAAAADHGMPEERLRFVTEARTENDSTFSEADDLQTFKTIVEDIERRQERLMERLVREARVSAHPISCIISDFFMWKWVSALALSHGLPLALFVSCSATFFYVHHLEQKCKGSEIEEVLVSGFGLPESGFLKGIKEEIVNFFNQMFDGIDSSGLTILINSFRDLEVPLLPFLDASPLDVRFIGPCLLSWTKDNVLTHNAMEQRSGSVFLEDHTCLPWLDKQEKGSVMFVSFGSHAEIKIQEQMEELALGIEASGRKFLWVVRKNTPAAGQPPEAFRERIQRGGGEMGMFASWVPQKRVLQHPAVGAFITHCGWNSTLESMTFGMPMLCMPFFGDQLLNADMVQEYWKTGLRLVASKSSGIVGREEVERCVRAMMPASPAMSSRVTQLQYQAAQAAIADAQHTLAAFIAAI